MSAFILQYVVIIIHYSLLYTHLEFNSFTFCKPLYLRVGYYQPDQFLVESLALCRVLPKQVTDYMMMSCRNDQQACKVKPLCQNHHITGKTLHREKFTRKVSLNSAHTLVTTISYFFTTIHITLQEHLSSKVPGSVKT